MEFKDFLYKKNEGKIIKYDFSNDCSCDEYKKIKSGIDKFITYMAYGSELTDAQAVYECDEDGIMQSGAKFIKDCKKEYEYIKDPDSYSKLLRQIYEILWNNKELMSLCKKEKGIQGETMNSANTTLDETYEKYIETQEQKEERERIKTKKGRTQPVSKNYIISRYSMDKENVKNKLKKINKLEEFLTTYHTLGNFLPVPVGCNRPGDNVKDYWDLTLLKIHRYYIEGIDEISDIIPNSNKNDKNKKYKEWLDCFEGEDGQEKWNNFVKINYMQDFVNKEGNNYGIPYELWKGHFNGGVLPKEREFEQYYKNTIKFIKKRTKRMLKELRIRIRKEKRKENNI